MKGHFPGHESECISSFSFFKKDLIISLKSQSVIHELYNISLFHRVMTNEQQLVKLVRGGNKGILYICCHSALHVVCRPTFCFNMHTLISCSFRFFQN